MKPIEPGRERTTAPLDGQAPNASRARVHPTHQRPGRLASLHL